MTREPDFARQKKRKGTTIEKIESPDLCFYKFLYILVGKKWNWIDRLFLNDKQIEEFISAPEASFFVLYHTGNPVGFAELRSDSTDNSIELVYIGLRPEYIGKGFGRFFLQSVIEQAWKKNPSRLWLHTCEHDHPKALEMYQKNGFELYKTENILQKLPEEHEKEEFYVSHLKSCLP